MIEIINGAKVLTSFDTNSTVLRSIVIPHSKNEYTVMDYQIPGQNTFKIRQVKTVNTETKVKAAHTMMCILGMKLKESKDILDDLTSDLEYRLTVNAPTNTENLSGTIASFIERMNECGVFVRQIITE